MEKRSNQSLRNTFIGFVLIVVIYLLVHPVWLLFNARTASEPSIIQRKSIHTAEGPADVVWTDDVNIYRNNIIYNVSDQGCEVINMRWGGFRYRSNGLRVYEVSLAMYFSEYALQTDTIVPGNRLVLYLENGDSLVTVSQCYYPASSMGNFRRYYAIHSSRESNYYPIYEQCIGTSSLVID
ncbi:MAG: hypothetical protein IJS82_04270 [Paludibacteraceae bacterium]|nr:hypothetical protein [Paludibacteraceae bacterium]